MGQIIPNTDCPPGFKKLYSYISVVVPPLIGIGLLHLRQKLMKTSPQVPKHSGAKPIFFIEIITIVSFARGKEK